MNCKAELEVFNHDAYISRLMYEYYQEHEPEVFDLGDPDHDYGSVTWGIDFYVRGVRVYDAKADRKKDRIDWMNEGF